MRNGLYVRMTMTVRRSFGLFKKIRAKLGPIVGWLWCRSISPVGSVDNSSLLFACRNLCISSAPTLSAYGQITEILLEPKTRGDVAMWPRPDNNNTQIMSLMAFKHIIAICLLCQIFGEVGFAGCAVPKHHAQPLKIYLQ